MRNCTMAVLFIILLIYSSCHMTHCAKGSYRHLGTWIALVSCNCLGLVYLWGLIGSNNQLVNSLGY